MTLSLKIPGASFTKFFDYAHIPYVENAQALFFLGTDAASSCANQIEGSAYPTASVIGTPVYGAGFATISGANGFDADFTGGNAPLTMICTHGSTTSTCGLVGFADGTTNKSLIYTVGANAMYANQDATVRLNGSAFTLPAGKHALSAYTFDGSNGYLRRAISRVMTTISGAYSSTGAAVKPFRVGASGVGPANTGPISSAAVFNRALTEAEILNVYDYLSLRLAARGITLA